MRYIKILLFPVVVSSVFAGGFDYSVFNKLLQQYVNDSGVNYSLLVKEKNTLDGYARILGKISPETHPEQFPGRNDKLAYWINAYNTFILKEIVDHYPVGSIKDINLIGVTVWLNKNLIGGKKISFKSLEDDYIRERFNDPRIHFAINCASISCPPLKNRVYLPETLEEQLEQSTKDFIDNKDNFRVDEKEKKIFLSAIFDWYESDFLNWLKREKKMENPHILDYIRKYSEQPVKSEWYGYDISVNDYNWDLNESKGK